jgi:hypothetical protein
MRRVTRNVAGTGSEQVKEVQNRVCGWRICLIIDPDGELEGEIE